MSHIRVILLAAGLALGGCDFNAPTPPSKSHTPPEPVGHVDRVSIFAMPTAVNLDEIPGPDGIRIQVYFYRVDQDMPVTVKGTVEVLMYEGQLRAGDLLKSRPFFTWGLTPGSMVQNLYRSAYGWHYAFDLRWDRPPQSSNVTIIARYTAPGEAPIYTDALSIATGPQ